MYKYAYTDVYIDIYMCVYIYIYIYIYAYLPVSSCPSAPFSMYFVLSSSRSVYVYIYICVLSQIVIPSQGVKIPQQI
jgi:hypothetical protein